MTTLRANNTALFLTIFGLVLLFFGCATQPQQAEQIAAPRLNNIAAVTAAQTPEGVRVTISGDGPLTFSSLKQPDPLAVVLYFPETSVSQLQVNKPEGLGLISRIQARDGSGNRTARIEIQLTADASYKAAQDGNSVQIDFPKAAAPAALAAAQSAEPAVQAQPAAGTAEATIAPAVLVTPAAQATASTGGKKGSAAQAGGAWVNKIDFLSEADGKSTLVIGTTHPVEYRVDKNDPRRVELRLLNTRIPSYRQRPLITTRFNSAVDRVVPVQQDKNKSESVVTIELREAVPFVTEQTDNMLFVHFDSSKIPPKPMEQADLPAWKRVLSGNENETVSLDTLESPTPAPSAMPAVAVTPIEPKQSVDSAFEREQKENAEIMSLLGPRSQVFTGEKIALDFYETDIKNVFRILREVSGKNFAIDKDVTGKVTMTLDKPVPWDQVLDLVLRMNQLGMAREGDIIRIATVESLKQEDDLRKAKIEAYKKAREEVKALEPLVTKYIPVSYSSAGSEVKPHIENILTKDRGSVSVDEKNNQIIITDTAAVVKNAEEIVRRIDKVTAQVVIEARVVEVSDNFSRELGITWDMKYGAGVLGDWFTTTDAAMNFPSEGGSSIGINFSRLSGVPFVLNARINALETTGEGKILSAPKILTLDNKKAKIKQGVEYPYLERDSSGGSSVAFKNIDLLLEVTPHVTPDNRISMVIYITKNDVAGITAGVPSVATNEAQTELLVNDGDTIVIGGIIKSSETKGQDGFPMLSSIPVLGWIFKNTTRKQQSNELLIFMTPRIVQLEQAVAQQ